MHVRKESPSKSSTSADQFLKFGDAKKLSLNIDTNQRIQVIVASLLVVLSVPVKYIYVKLMPCSNTHALSLSPSKLHLQKELGFASVEEICHHVQVSWAHGSSLLCSALLYSSAFKADSTREGEKQTKYEMIAVVCLSVRFPSLACHDPALLCPMFRFLIPSASRHHAHRT